MPLTLKQVEQCCLDWVREVRRVSSVALVSRSLFRLVEHDGLGVLVHHLSHVSQDVLLGDDAQEAPEQTREVRGHPSSHSAKCFSKMLFC